jgi:hypothetical protein
MPLDVGSAGVHGASLQPIAATSSTAEHLAGNTLVKSSLLPLNWYPFESAA